MSLEGVLDFSSPPSLTQDELARASNTFSQLLNHCEPLQANRPYKKVTLVRLTYEHARSKETFLLQFFLFVGTQVDSEDGSPPGFSEGLSRFSGFGATSSSVQKKDAERAVDSFAEYIFDYFFLPLKASGEKTPQPTPATLSAPSLENVTGSAARISTLRRDCLIRDHHRCVATRAFDRDEATERAHRDGLNAKDDEGQPLIHARDTLARLEVAHIIPHSLTSLGDKKELSESKKTALAILNMFDPGIIHEIEGSNIDRPSNAITLTREVHGMFGKFEIYFEPSDAAIYPPHTYKIDSPATNILLYPSWLPVTRTLLLSPNRTVDPPSRRLLSIHRACAIILRLSAAAEYIDEILRDTEEIFVKSDGSSQLGRLVSLKLGGWMDGVAV